MKLLIVMPFSIGIEEPNLQPFINILKENYASVQRSDTEIVIRTNRRGLDSNEYFDSPGLRLLNEPEILKTMVRGEKDFDGMIPYCNFDSGLRAARALLDIPVVGPAESSYHFASMMGAKFASITAVPAYIPEMTENIHKYGVQQSAIERNPVRALTIPISEVDASYAGNYQPVIDNIKEVAAGCIEDGAEVLTVNCGALSPIISHAGLREIDGVPIIDSELVALKTLEALVDLHKAGIPVINRKGLYYAPPAELKQKAIDLFVEESGADTRARPQLQAVG